MSVLTRTVDADPRTLMQNAKLAIRDVFDAIVELVTNSDDSYKRLNSYGRIEIEIERRRGAPSILRVRDFAEGMTHESMNSVLSRMGGRVSGLESGLSVRGTNSRGAKDVAAIGPVRFDSIADDGTYNHCEISQFLEFNLLPSKSVSDEVRVALKIPKATGTVVTIEIDPTVPVPHHGNLKTLIGSLVQLRDIVADKDREIVLIDVGRGLEEKIRPLQYLGKERVSKTIRVPGYPSATAKLKIYRAPKRFERTSDRFRKGGVLVKSRHAIHEATLFDRSLDSDDHAQWFYGKLVCPSIDLLWNDYDERFENKLEPDPDNPVPILDPSRKSGLTREHPFVKRLYKEALKHLRPLVEAERRASEAARVRIESSATRKRLDKLERAASQFMEEFGEEDLARDSEDKISRSKFVESGYVLSPPYAKIVKGGSRKCMLTVNLESFPELEVGDSVQVHCATSDIVSDQTFIPLQKHESKDGVLVAAWNIKALEVTSATVMKARVGEVIAESAIEIIASEKDLYADITGLKFQRSRYTVRAGAKRKRMKLLADSSTVSETTIVELGTSNKEVRVPTSVSLVPKDRLGIAVADFAIRLPEDGPVDATLTATAGSRTTTTKVSVLPPRGSRISIRLEDIDLTNQRYRWRKNELEIAAKHPSLSRYLGSKADGFPGQETPHFRLLLAEIVAEAVCAQLLGENTKTNPHDFEDADWDLYYAELSKLKTRFLPIAHELVIPKTRT
ncbi:hypothetical protein ACFLRO_01045 [Bacteroidota bacterium]